MFNPFDHLKPNEIAWYLLLDEKDRQLADGLMYYKSLGPEKGKKLLVKRMKQIQKRGKNV